MKGTGEGTTRGDGSSAPPDERTYSGDMVLLFLFVVLAAVVALLFFVHSRMDRSMEEGRPATVELAG